MKMKQILTIVIAILVCNCSTPYQPKEALGGYSSNQLNENNYKVSFKGNQHTTAEAVFDYLLRRCAEITIEEKGKYFIIYEDSSYINKIIFIDEPDIDVKIASHRRDNYLLDKQPVLDANPRQTLQDQKTKIVRIYHSGTIDNESTDVVGIYKIQIFEEQIEGYEDYFFSATEILKKYDDG
jgi:hypothetical protein